jgi:leader peptidase (prepilin peptidase)/N-methyltransferase
VLKHLVVFSILAPHFPLQIINFMLIDAIGTMIFYWLLIALAVLDAENLWLPNWITLPGIALGFLYRLAGAAFLPSFNQTNWLKDHLIGTTAIISLVSIVIAAGLILLIRWTYWLIRRREGVGLGDAKLMALLAAWLGLPQALLAFAVGVMLGSLAAMVVLLVPKARRESGSWAASKLPLGTFLCIGGIVSSLWGQPILSAYLRWAGF